MGGFSKSRYLLKLTKRLKGPYFVTQKPNFKQPFACFKVDALFFKRQEIQRSFFLISQIFHE